MSDFMKSSPLLDLYDTQGHDVSVVSEFCLTHYTQGHDVSEVSEFCLTKLELAVATLVSAGELAVL